MLDPNTISQLVAVILMVAPSASDNHLENHSVAASVWHMKPGMDVSSEIVLYDICEEVASNFNQLGIWATYEGGTYQPHAWCKGIYK